ncbi:MAG: tRNA (adenosine(37)-N6)-dimethylallyltransferase MiaA [Acutalibacteraceae bacterium]
MKKPLVAVVAGPTASGKTALAVEIAKKLGGEIVSADSMQIYEGMDIATAKPTEEEMQGIPHHLIGFLNPGESFSVAKYKTLALEKIREILSRGKLPIVAGGTGLYIDTLIDNTSFLDYEASDIRVRLEERAESEGMESLYRELTEIDRPTAEKLHIHDRKRIIRALEVYYATGETITKQCELSHAEESEFSWCVIGLSAKDRSVLYDRINRRVDVMLDRGLLEEAKDFFGDSRSATAAQAIGYKELMPYFDGEATLAEAVENLKMQTRRYAKRQLTWFRRRESMNWLYIDEMNQEELTKSTCDIILQKGETNGE